LELSGVPVVATMGTLETHPASRTLESFLWAMSRNTAAFSGDEKMAINSGLVLELFDFGTGGHWAQGQSLHPRFSEKCLR
jgi:hypothetical protein